MRSCASLLALIVLGTWLAACGVEQPETGLREGGRGIGIQGQGLLPPGAVTGTVTGEGHVRVSWVDGNVAEDGYIVERRLPDSVNWALIGQFPADTSSTVDREVSSNRTYFYRVVAYAGALTRPSMEVRVTVEDGTPPDTEIIFRPPPLTNSRSARFVFRSTEGASTFICALDGNVRPCNIGLECYAGEDTCVGQFVAAGLADGEHTFEAQAVDLAGNIDPTPASVTWRIDNTPPVITVGSQPPALTNSGDVFISFALDDTRATASCQLNAEPPVACNGTFSANLGFASGPQQVVIRARDPLGNQSQKLIPWTIDNQPPSVAFTHLQGRAVGAAGSNNRYVRFPDPLDIRFTANDEIPGHIAALDCRLYSTDGGGFNTGFAPCPGIADPNCEPCIASYSGLGLASGNYALEVSTTDGLGNRTWPIPPLHRLSFTVDNDPPVLSWDRRPADPAPFAYLRWRYGANEPVTGTSCRLDGGSWQACAPTIDLARLPSGASPNVEVVAWDRAGNAGWITDSVNTLYPAVSQNPADGAGDFIQALDARATICFFDGNPVSPCPDVNLLERGNWHYAFGQHFGTRVQHHYRSTRNSTSGYHYLFGENQAYETGSDPKTRHEANRIAIAPPAAGVSTSARVQPLNHEPKPSLRKSTWRFGFSVTWEGEYDRPDRIVGMDRVDFAAPSVDHLILRHASPERGWLISPDDDWELRALAKARTVDSGTPTSLALSIRAPLPGGELETLPTRGAVLPWSGLEFSAAGTAVVDLPLQAPYCAGWFELQVQTDPPLSDGNSTAAGHGVLRVPLRAPAANLDRHEPNDTQGAAATGFTAPGLLLDNLVLSADGAGEDWYRVEAVSTDTVTITANLPGSGPPAFTLAVHDEGDPTPIASASSSGGTASLSGVGFVTGNRYDIRIHSASPPTCRRYSLSID